MTLCSGCNHDKKSHFVWAHTKDNIELVNCRGGGYELQQVGVGFISVSKCNCTEFEEKEK